MEPDTRTLYRSLYRLDVHHEAEGPRYLWGEVHLAVGPAKTPEAARAMAQNLLDGLGAGYSGTLHGPGMDPELIFPSR